MTMSVSHNEIEYLASEIITNLKPVTYHKFSRHLNIPIARAKTTLLEYYEKNKSTLAASFIITGNTKSGKLVKLAKEEDLDSDLKKFDNINCVHIYCVSKKLIDLTTTDIAREELKFPSSLNKIAEYEQNGMIKGPALKAVVPENVPSSRALPSTPTPIPSKQKVEPKRETATTFGLTSSYVSRKQTKNQNVLHFKGSSGNASRKTDEPSEPPYKYKTRKPIAPKERIIVSNDGDNQDKDGEEEEDDDEPIKATRATNTSDLQRMFDGDDYTFSDDNDETPKESTEELKSDIFVESPKEDNSTKKEEEPVQEQTNEPSLFVEEEDDEDDDEIEEIIVNGQSKEETPLFVQEEDEEGYIVTRKAKPVTKPPKAKKPEIRLAVTKPPTGAKKDGKRKQSSLLDFFSKKK